MHSDILTKTQAGLLPLIKQFDPAFYLVGGTALALQLGHRRSTTFYVYPYTIKHQTHFEHIISLPDTQTIAAMKAFALGKRAK